jgi:hypothetical protein
MRFLSPPVAGMNGWKSLVALTGIEPVFED